MRQAIAKEEAAIATSMQEQMVADEALAGGLSEAERGTLMKKKTMFLQGKEATLRNL